MSNMCLWKSRYFQVWCRFGHSGTCVRTLFFKFGFRCVCFLKWRFSLRLCLKIVMPEKCHRTVCLAGAEEMQFTSDESECKYYGQPSCLPPNSGRNFLWFSVRSIVFLSVFPPVIVPWLFSCFISIISIWLHGDARNISFCEMRYLKKYSKFWERTFLRTLFLQSTL